MSVNKNLIKDLMKSEMISEMMNISVTNKGKISISGRKVKSYANI